MNLRPPRLPADRGLRVLVLELLEAVAECEDGGSYAVAARAADALAVELRRRAGIEPDLEAGRLERLAAAERARELHAGIASARATIAGGR